MNIRFNNEIKKFFDIEDSEYVNGIKRYWIECKNNEDMLKVKTMCLLCGIGTVNSIYPNRIGVSIKELASFIKEL